jgi:GxxExxY protein
MEQLLYKELTEQIISAYYEVYNELGFGFLEKCYQNALFYELQDRGFQVEAKRKVRVLYKQRVIGNYEPDLIVNGLVIIELKAVEYLITDHETQLYNYLRSTDCEVGLLMNFGTKPEFRRKAFSNSRKKFNQ